MTIDNSRLPEGWDIKTLEDVLRLEYGKPLDKVDRIESGKYPVYIANGENARRFTKKVNYRKKQLFSKWKQFKKK